MKSYVVLLVTAIMLIKPLWPIAEYIANYDYITNVLCENRDKPQLQCNGKCYLSKQLAKEAEQNDKNPFGERLFSELLQTVFFEPISDINLKALLFEREENNFDTPLNLVQKLLGTDIAEPPELG